MSKDLTVSRLDYQNILNNGLAIAEIQKQTRTQGIYFEDKICFTKSMDATYFEVEPRTVERYVSENQREISDNGYEVLNGKRLKDFLACVREQNVPDINVGNISNRTTQLAIFDFRSLLKLAMSLGFRRSATISTSPFLI